MTTSDTQDIPATVRQSIALAEVGCEIVRITAPNVQAAKCLREIREQFTAAGFGHIPLVADIHFLPSAAMEAVEHVEKVRVNPGNYADKKKFAVKEYSDADYQRELERLHEAFSAAGVAREGAGPAPCAFGTNHGSLSRSRHEPLPGDTPLGMVESALEFLRIARSHQYHELILSMKASNPKVMIQAYRLLVERMQQEDMHYPLHLGRDRGGRRRRRPDQERDRHRQPAARRPRRHHPRVAHRGLRVRNSRGPGHRRQGHEPLVRRPPRCRRALRSATRSTRIISPSGKRPRCSSRRNAPSDPSNRRGSSCGSPRSDRLGRVGETAFRAAHAGHSSRGTARPGQHRSGFWRHCPSAPAHRRSRSIFWPSKSILRSGPPISRRSLAASRNRLMLVRRFGPG